MTMNPAPLYSNLFWQAPPVPIYLPQAMPPIWPRPVKMYQPPLSSSDVALWSALHLHALANATQIARKILPDGWRHDHLWKDRYFIVALRRGYVQEANQILCRGAWVCPSMGVYGENLAELYAYVNQRPYSDAVHALADEGKLLGSSDQIYPKNQVRNWRQERYPLHQDVEARYLPPIYPADSEFQVYLNMSGHPILQAIRTRPAIAEKICVYRSLWGYRSGTVPQWVEVFPQPPFPIFNMHMIPLRPNRPVVLVKDEFTAAELGQTYPNSAFIAVPGGFKNLARADLEHLRGREILVVFDVRDLEEGRRIHNALLTAGATDASFSVDEGKTFKSFVELENIAAQRGVTLLPPPLELIAPPQARFVIAAGEKIPDGDKVRRNLIYPIIPEGYIIWLYADPKIGKTWVALSMAYAVARGNCKVGRWHTTDPAGVLYVDGEMKPDQLHESISMIMAGAGDLAGPAPFDIICAQALDEGLVDITSEEAQIKIKKILNNKNIKLLILDNIQALTSNKPSAVDQLFPWFRKLARAGIAVVVVDHTNSDGDVQGSRAKERIPDLLIALSRAEGRTKGNGRIQVEFPFARRLHGEDAEPFQLQMVFSDGTFRFEVVKSEADNQSSLRPNVLKRVLRMALVVFARDDEELSYPKLHKKYGISQSTAHGYYHTASKLIGDEKAVFDRELQRLIDG